MKAELGAGSAPRRASSAPGPRPPRPSAGRAGGRRAKGRRSDRPDRHRGPVRARGSDVAGLNELDNQAVAACEAGDEEQFRAAFGELLEYVRTHGAPVPEDELVASDVILPPPDVSLEEARAEFSGEGLIPG